MIRKFRWQITIALGGMLLILGLLTGGQPPRAVSLEPEPVAGGAYAEALVGTTLRLNPVLDFANQVDRDIDRLLYRGLVRFDSRGNPTPDLAEDWAVSADGTLYTFTLRADARWHDGTPVTADDVVYTFSKFQDPDYPGPEDLKAFWENVRVIALEDQAVQFQLPEPFAPFLDYVAVGLLPDHLLRGVSVTDLVDHPFHLEPVGTGPFQFDRFILEDDRIVGVSLVPSETYEGEGPFLERFEFRFYPSQAAAYEAYKRGEVQGLGQVGQAQLPEVLADPGLNLYAAPLPRLGLVFLNLKHPEKTFFAEKPVRQALLAAINRQWIVDKALQGQAILAVGPIRPGTWAYSDSLTPDPFDPVRAARLLDDAGWELPVGAEPGDQEYLRSKEGVPLAFELTYPDLPVYQTIAEALQANWAAIGVKVSLAPVEPEALLEEVLEPRAFEAVLTELDLGPYPDPDPYPFWHDSQAESGQNYGGFTDRNISIWLEQARTNPDYGRRAQLYRSFQHRFQDQVPALLLYYPVYNYAVSSEIQGVSVGPLTDPSDRFATVERWHILARRRLSPVQEPSPTP